MIKSRIRAIESMLTSKELRIWDAKHDRWFQGGTNTQKIKNRTDSVHLFGEINIMQGVLHDQHEDNIWRDDPDIHTSIEMYEWLIPVCPLGFRDKNGREVFEGDIIELHSSKWHEQTVKGAVFLHNGKVRLYVWDETAGWIEQAEQAQVFSSGGVSTMCLKDTDEIEIMSNVFEESKVEQNNR